MSRANTEVEEGSKIEGGFSFFRQKIVKRNSFGKSKMDNSGNGNKSDNHKKWS